MRTAYCLSGLGADERIFQKLVVPGLSFQYLKWVKPEGDEPLQEYTRKLASQIKEERPFIIGVSFGGMVGIEIAKMMPVAAVTLISSVKSCKELPAWMKACGSLSLDRLLPDRPLKEAKALKLLRPVQNYFLGASSREEKKLANEYRDDADPVYLKWAIRQVLNWKNDWQPERVFHLHGDKDHIFPIKKVRPTQVIRNAGHFMVMSHAEEISEALKRISDFD